MAVDQCSRSAISRNDKGLTLILDCRHSFASRALALGESLPVIAMLLGHRQIRTTSRNAHVERDSVKASAARVAASIAGDFVYGGRSAKARPPDR